MGIRHVVVWGLLLVAYAVGGAPLAAFQADGWRTSFAAGEEARAASDWSSYASHMAAAAAAMPDGHLNRPFVQYHAARAAALDGRDDEAVVWLRRAWDEDIEALMISFARFDPGFAGLDGMDAFEGVLDLAGSMSLPARQLGGAVVLLQGAGSNVVVQSGEDGLLVIDTGYGPALPALRAALGTMSGPDVDVLVITHPHEDHMGATPELGAEATVYAHPGTAAAMREPYVFMEGVELPPKPVSALPDIEVARDTSIAFNGETVRLVPTVAHTAGDLSVYFTESRVVHLGDTYLAGNPMMFPGSDDPKGFLDALEAFLDSMHPETVVVSGHDEPTDLDAVRAQIAASRACWSLVREAVGEGLTLEETAERADGLFAPQWVAFFYRLEVAQGG